MSKNSSQLARQDKVHFAKDIKNETLNLWATDVFAAQLLYATSDDYYICRICIDSVLMKCMDHADLCLYSKKNSNTTSIKRHIASKHQSYPDVQSAPQGYKAFIDQKEKQRKITTFGVSTGVKRCREPGQGTYTVEKFQELYLKAVVSSTITMYALQRKEIYNIIELANPGEAVKILCRRVLQSLMDQTFERKQVLLRQLVKCCNFKICLLGTVG